MILLAALLDRPLWLPTFEERAVFPVPRLPEWVWTEYLDGPKRWFDEKFRTQRELVIAQNVDLEVPPPPETVHIPSDDDEDKNEVHGGDDRMEGEAAGQDGGQTQGEAQDEEESDDETDDDYDDDEDGRARDPFTEGGFIRKQSRKRQRAAVLRQAREDREMRGLNRLHSVARSSNNLRAQTWWIQSFNVH